MKTLLTWMILTLMTFGCDNHHSQQDEKLLAKETQKNTDSIFREVVEFPTIKDTGNFIKNLRQIFRLDIEESPAQKAIQKISTFEKVKIYGSENDYFFIEYDYGVGSMSSYPWKYQLLLTTDGRLIKSLSSQRFEFVTIFPNQNPFLLAVIATAKGNGRHEIYKISADTLQNVYEGYYNHAVQTYDAHEDLSVFEPYELNIDFKDDNNDGFNDIVFTGKNLMLGKYTKDSLWYEAEDGKQFTVRNPANRISIACTFLYDKQTGHFRAKENYSLGK